MDTEQRIVELFDSACIKQIESLGCDIERVDVLAHSEEVLRAYIEATSEDISVMLCLNVPKALLVHTMPASLGEGDADIERDWVLELSNRFLGRLKNKLISQLEKEITLRYLKTRKKDGFLNVISIFSFIGISLGVAVLIIVMSVMNGFRTELVEKIVGFNPHAVIKPYDLPINESLFNDKDLIKLSNTFVYSNSGEGVLINKDYTKGLLLRGYLSKDFENRADGGIPEDLNVYKIDAGNDGIGVGQILKSINFVSSTSEAMRLIKAGGVKIDGEKISLNSIEIKSNSELILSQGKRLFIKVKII